MATFIDPHPAGFGNANNPTLDTPLQIARFQMFRTNTAEFRGAGGKGWGGYGVGGDNKQTPSQAVDPNWSKNWLANNQNILKEFESGPARYNPPGVQGTSGYSPQSTASQPYTPTSPQSQQMQQTFSNYQPGQTFTPPQGGGYNPTTGVVTPYVPGGQAYSGPPSDYTQFPTMPMPPIGEPLKLSGYAGAPDFEFNFDASQQKAYNELKPFYDKLLSFAGGRLDLALRILDYSYQQGMREATGEHSMATREQALTFPVEQETQQTEQNKRGITTSGFGNTARGRLSESQGLRREAVDRALQERESRLGAEQGFGREEKFSGFNEERFDLERERQQEAKGMALDRFGLKKSAWESQLAKGTYDEQKKAQEEANKASSATYNIYQ